MCVALFFWAWAVYNTVTKHQFDAGIVTFLLAAVSSTYLVASSTSVPIRLGQCLIVASYVLVSVNYLAGAVLAFTVLNRPGFGIYCLVFSVLWMGIAGIGNRLLSKSRCDSHDGNCERDSIKINQG